jgi:hypothetical protein
MTKPDPKNGTSKERSRHHKQKYFLKQLFDIYIITLQTANFFYFFQKNKILNPNSCEKFIINLYNSHSRTDKFLTFLEK